MPKIDILLVEDNEHKRERIKEVVRDSLGESGCRVEEASCYVDACEKLEQKTFDLLILDLLIPRTDDAEPDAGLSITILRAFGRSNPRMKCPKYVVGLTAFSDARKKFDAEFESKGWRLLRYDNAKLDWCEHLATFSEHVSKHAARTEPTSDAVLVLHGIRDFGSWQTSVKRVIEDETIKVFTVKYGRFGLLRFISPRIPIDFTRKPIRRLQEEYANALSQYPGARISVIAHSFGTYVLAEFLKNNPHVRIYRVVLCGSVISQEFPWSRVQLQFGDSTNTAKEEFVINDCGNADKWPTMARSIGYGDIGTNGAGTTLVTDRFHDGSHGLFFDEQFIRTYWKPFIETGKIVQTNLESRSELPWTVFPFELAPAWLVLTAVGTIVFVSSYYPIAFGIAVFALIVWLVCFIMR